MLYCHSPPAMTPLLQACDAPGHAPRRTEPGRRPSTAATVATAVPAWRVWSEGLRGCSLRIVDRNFYNRPVVHPKYVPHHRAAAHGQRTLGSSIFHSMEGNKMSCLSHQQLSIYSYYMWDKSCRTGKNGANVIHTQSALENKKYILDFYLGQEYRHVTLFQFLLP